MANRPENPYTNHGAVLKEMGNEIAFEAGADAMLEGLKSKGFRCGLIDIRPIMDGSASDPLKFSIITQSIVEEKDGATIVSLPSFCIKRIYPPKKGWLVFIEEE